MYRGKDCTEVKILQRACNEIINFKKKKEINLLTNELQKSHKNSNFCYICKENIENKYVKEKNIVKYWIIIIAQRNIEVLHTVYFI